MKKNSLTNKISNQSTTLITELGFSYIANSLYFDSLFEGRIGEEGIFRKDDLFSSLKETVLTLPAF